MSEYGPPEIVFTENEWYDGPRAGVANVNGKPHRFKSLFDETEDQFLGTFLVWPVDQRVVELEQEQWRIFAGWNELYEAGTATTDSHPGHGGKSERWDEIEVILKSNRREVSPFARRAQAELVPLQGEVRYPAAGPSYMLSWRLL